MTIGPTVDAPDLTEEVVGFRTFAVKQNSQHDYGLFSPYQQTCEWTASFMKAECNVAIPETPVELPAGCRLENHSAPHPGCGCGIYAYYKPIKEPPARLYSNGAAGRFAMYAIGGDLAQIVGAVTLSGKLEAHAKGLRAEKARIRALGLHKGLSDYERVAVQGIAKRLGVVAVEQDQLERVASEFGDVLPEHLRPAEEEKAGAVPSLPSLYQQALADAGQRAKPKWWKRLWVREWATYVTTYTAAWVVVDGWCAAAVGLSWCLYHIGKAVGMKGAA